MESLHRENLSFEQRELHIMDENQSDRCENLELQEDPTQLGIDETDSLNRVETFVNKRYKMNHPRRGRAIIFNHYKFQNNYGDRKGTGSDVKKLIQALLQLGFEPDDIIIYHDLTAGDISHKLQKVQKEDHSDCDLLMVFVLTHGTHSDRISAFDVEYPVDTLWAPFAANRCKSLAGKPKIFFVVACRGEIQDKGHELPIKDVLDETEVDARPIEYCQSYTIPVWADFLYVFSTYKGHVSYRNIDTGTWYIQAFCNELTNTNISQVSFTDFLTAVNGQLSGFEGGTFGEPKKQIPTFSSTLTKCLYFKEKKPI